MTRRPINTRADANQVMPRALAAVARKSRVLVALVLAREALERSAPDTNRRGDLKRHRAAIMEVRGAIQEVERG